uniref:SHSP domain-containing protein n=1 Tax=Clastoptera arizonana TaxID=38151 RepID=A0A1B6EBJ4_9HEMI
MALHPFIFNELLNELNRPTIFDQNFGLGIPSNELACPIMPFYGGYYRPYHRYMEPRESGTSNIVNDKEGFKVNLDVQQFKPEELKVKVVDDFVVVEGKHEERSDAHGYIARQFTRRYKLPKDINTKALESKLSSDGVLQLHAPKLALPNAKEISIPIIHTNQPAIKQQTKEPIEESKGKKEEKPTK